MEQDKINIVLQGKRIEVNKGITLEEVEEQYYEKDMPIVTVAKVDGVLQELMTSLSTNCTVEFLDISDKDGFRVYQRSVKFLLIRSIYDVLGRKNVEKVCIQYSLSNGYFCEILGKKIELTDKLLSQIEEHMKNIVEEDISIEKDTYSLDAAMELFRKYKMFDKLNLFKYRRVSTVNLYKLGWMQDYFYGYMVPSSGKLKYFKLRKYHHGFILQFPTREEPSKLEAPVYREKLFHIFKESERWGDIIGVGTVGGLNNEISSGKTNDLILVSEALHEKKLGEIADQIIHSEYKKGVILIAGPSSSGKTTFSHRLSIQLRVQGIKPNPISIDNYFVNREHTPVDEEGNYDFESIDAIDIQQFNDDINKLLRGEAVEIPTFNFKTGRREYKGNILQLEEEDVLVIEGIHGLNEKLSNQIPKEKKFKIYVSALTQLNVDDHNRIPTTDARLLRRIVRDNQYRGVDAAKTIKMWPSVRRGEEKYIFPFQEEADIMFNSALVYEFSILKQFAEPLLFNIERNSPEFLEAKRLIKFLDYFLGVSSEDVPKNSILREFIGGSCFRK